MDIGFILLGLLGLAVVLAFVHVVSKMAREREVAAHRKQKGSKEQHIATFTGDTITHLGHS
jgi:uncharacterized protein YpmS